MRAPAPAFLFILGLSACTNAGQPPPVGRLNFPIAIGLSPSGDQLYVVSSNFDLRYNGGVVQSYDVGVMNRLLDESCGARPLAERDECGVIPTQDEREDLTDDITRVEGLLLSEVVIGSYADGLAIAENADGSSRLYLPVRSDANLTYIDARADGVLCCTFDSALCQGAPGELAAHRHDCDEAHRRGVDDAATVRGISLPADPVGLHVGELSQLVEGAEEDASYVLMAHRGGRVSLFLDRPVAGDSRPELIHSAGGFPDELVDLTVDPLTGTAWIPSALAPEVARAGIAVDPLDNARSYVFDAGGAALTGIDTGSTTTGDTRVLRFDPRPDVRRAYVLSRRPRALITVDVDDSVGTLDFTGLVPVGFGPSRLEIARFESHDGRTLAFVSCFDSRDLYVIDVDLQMLVGVVRGQGGPFELVVDTVRDRVYVLDFRSSVIRVIDLAPMFECLDDADFDPMMMSEASDECSPQTVGIVGRPRAVQELI